MAMIPQNSKAFEAIFNAFYGSCKCDACTKLKGLSKIKDMKQKTQELKKIVDLALKNNAPCHFSDLLKSNYRMIEHSVKTGDLPK